MRNSIKKSVLACFIALSLLPFHAAGAAKSSDATATPVATIPESTISPYAAEYDADHPENLEADQLYAQSAILIEASSGDVIFDKDAYTQMYPGSTTKILTIWLGITMVEDLDMEVTVSETAVDVPEDSSTMKLQAGEIYTFRDILYGTMLLSANDGANVIAETVSGSISAFVDLMNTTAADVIGCSNTHFMNPHGYHDDNHYTTAADLALIARTAMQNETFREIAATYTYTLPKTNMSRSRTITNTNMLIKPSTEDSTNKYYYAYANGIKTGSTSKAGYCFVGSAEKDNVSLISVILYSANKNRWVDTIKLFEYGFSQYTSVTPVDLYNMNPVTIETSGYSLDDAQLGKLKLNCVPVDSAAASKAIIIATNAQIKSMASSLRTLVYIQYTRDFTAPIEAGEQIGTMIYFTDSGEEIEYKLTASRSIEKRKDAPKTLAEIIEDTKNDPNPFPRLTPEMVFLVLLPLILFAVLVLGSAKLIYAHKRRRTKIPKIPKRHVH